MGMLNILKAFLQPSKLEPMEKSFDQSICNQARGGQNILLTNYHKFQSLAKAILHSDGIKHVEAGYYFP